MDDDLDDELRRLFSDDRLDVHATPDATDAVLRGADRRRRRRSAVSTAFAVVTLVGAGVGLTQLRSSGDHTADELLPTSVASTSSTPPSTSTVYSTSVVTVPAPPSNPSSGNPGTGNPNPGTSTKPRTTTPLPPPPPSEQPSKVDGLALGMTEADALKTGSLVEPGSAADPQGKCTAYATKSVPDPNAAIISPARGIVWLTLPSYAKTSKGVTVGTSVADVKAAYPTATQSGSGLRVEMAATPKWSYIFETDGAAVTAVRMRLNSSDCPGY
ncbi:hypothetical protein UK23_20025 [Lentzea aerocolonigenes]|uniref:Uncharacterized protein n=1 Tax=Lentzea aerocolonigenes TaxID=68170 RepID=A0A0F0GYD5_LENAE|nr:hypothetical protein [Lentzea aerocolonigenes]KJK47591.1 hypothetical protein UK23_20025 [Lentzea aerocolonigenes]